jgi:putative membrane protein
MTVALFDTITTLPLAWTGHDSGPWDGEWWWVWRLTMFLVLIALVVLTIWLTRRYAMRPEPSGVERARGILAERYARGEIDSDEYRERLAQLD